MNILKTAKCVLISTSLMLACTNVTHAFFGLFKSDLSVGANSCIWACNNADSQVAKIQLLKDEKCEWYLFQKGYPGSASEDSQATHIGMKLCPPPEKYKRGSAMKQLFDKHNNINTSFIRGERGCPALANRPVNSKEELKSMNDILAKEYHHSHLPGFTNHCGQRSAQPPQRVQFETYTSVKEPNEDNGWEQVQFETYTSVIEPNEDNGWEGGNAEYCAQVFYESQSPPPGPYIGPFNVRYDAKNKSVLHRFMYVEKSENNKLYDSCVEYDTAGTRCRWFNDAAWYGEYSGCGNEGECNAWVRCTADEVLELKACIRDGNCLGPQ